MYKRYVIYINYLTLFINFAIILIVFAVCLIGVGVFNKYVNNSGTNNGENKKTDITSTYNKLNHNE